MCIYGRAGREINKLGQNRTKTIVTQLLTFFFYVIFFYIISKLVILCLQVGVSIQVGSGLVDER